MSLRCRGAGAGAVLGVLVAFAAVPDARAATTPCPSTFQVQHDDRIGSAQLPKGSYRIRVSKGVTCAAATSLFTAFLQHYDGVLPDRWKATSRAAGRARFARRSPRQAFTVRRTTGGGDDPRKPTGDLTCPGSFRVLNDDAVGKLRIPAGNYRLTRLSALSPTCTQVSSLFRAFLQRPDGRLPGGWVVLAAEGAFVKDSVHNGFHIERLR